MCCFLKMTANLKYVNTVHTREQVLFGHPTFYFKVSTKTCQLCSVVSGDEVWADPAMQRSRSKYSGTFYSLQFSLSFFPFRVLTFGPMICISCFNTSEIKQEFKSIFCKGQTGTLGSGAVTERISKSGLGCVPIKLYL